MEEIKFLSRYRDADKIFILPGAGRFAARLEHANLVSRQDFFSCKGVNGFANQSTVDGRCGGDPQPDADVP